MLERMDTKYPGGWDGMGRKYTGNENAWNLKCLNCLRKEMPKVPKLPKMPKVNVFYRFYENRNSR